MEVSVDKKRSRSFPSDWGISKVVSTIYRSAFFIETWADKKRFHSKLVPNRNNNNSGANSASLKVFS